jgi:hypothetical protein
MAHPDKIKDGMTTYTNTTRGDLKKLLPTCQQPDAKDVAKRKALDKKLQDYRDADQRKADEQMKPIETANISASGRPMTPEQRRIRRCVTSGRVPATCTGNALMNGLDELTGHALSTAVPDLPPGPAIAGAFEGAGKWRIEFSDRAATLTCAGLSPDPYRYNLQFRDNRAFVTVNTAPKPTVLTFRGNEDIAGSGPLVIDGRVIVGYSKGGGSSGGSAGHYETQQTTTHQELTPLEATQYAGQNGLSQNGQTYDMASTSSESSWVPGSPRVSSGPVPLYGPKRATCAAPALSARNAAPGGTEVVTGLLTSLFNNGDKGPPTPPGIRMHGIFAAPSGFSVEFFPESAILGCGPDAARAYPYTVIADGTRVAIKIDAPDHPLILAVRSDGSLDPGSSSAYLVHGRTLLNDHSDEFHFSPFELTCNLAVLSPSKSIPEVGGNSTASLNASRPAPPPVAGDATLSFVSALPVPPGTPNPMAGRPLALLHTSFDEMVLKSGVQVAAGTTPFKVFSARCALQAPECQIILNAMKTNMAYHAWADAKGNGTLANIAPGTYYLFLSARYNNQGYIWLQSIRVNSGQNTFTVDLRNATPVN